MHAVIRRVLTERGLDAEVSRIGLDSPVDPRGGDLHARRDRRDRSRALPRAPARTSSSSSAPSTASPDATPTRLVGAPAPRARRSRSRPRDFRISRPAWTARPSTSSSVSSGAPRIATDRRVRRAEPVRHDAGCLDVDGASHTRCALAHMPTDLRNRSLWCDGVASCTSDAIADALQVRFWGVRGSDLRVGSAIRGVRRPYALRRGPLRRAPLRRRCRHRTCGARPRARPRTRPPRSISSSATCISITSAACPSSSRRSSAATASCAPIAAISAARAPGKRSSGSSRRRSSRSSSTSCPPVSSIAASGPARRFTFPDGACGRHASRSTIPGGATGFRFRHARPHASATSATSSIPTPGPIRTSRASCAAPTSSSTTACSPRASTRRCRAGAIRPGRRASSSARPPTSRRSRSSTSIPATTTAYLQGRRGRDAARHAERLHRPRAPGLHVPGPVPKAGRAAASRRSRPPRGVRPARRWLIAVPALSRREAALCADMLSPDAPRRARRPRRCPLCAGLIVAPEAAPRALCAGAAECPLEPPGADAAGRRHRGRSPRLPRRRARRLRRPPAPVDGARCWRRPLRRSLWRSSAPSTTSARCRPRRGSSCSSPPSPAVVAAADAPDPARLAAAWLERAPPGPRRHLVREPRQLHGRARLDHRRRDRPGHRPSSPSSAPPASLPPAPALAAAAPAAARSSASRRSTGRSRGSSSAMSARCRSASWSAGCSCELAADGALAAAVLLPLYYLADATITLLRRLARGERVWEAHRSHFYQQATDNGFSALAVERPRLRAQPRACGARRR